jgi:hypothetical protein
MNPSPITQYAVEARHADLLRRSLETTRTIGHRPSKRRRPFRRLVVTVVVAATAAGTVTPSADAGPPEPTVPSTIQAPDGNRVFLVGHASGFRSTPAPPPPAASLGA